MLVLQYNVLMLGYGNDEFEEFERISVDAFCGATSTFSFNADFNHDHGYLIALQVKADIQSNCYVSIYNGVNKQDTVSLLLRCEIDINQDSMLNAEPQNNAILLKNERVNTALEYAEKKLICAVADVELLIIVDWKNIQTLKDPQLNNIKTCLQLLPGFNVDQFPFILCNGGESINLINVRDNQIQTLIKSGCETQHHAFFFLPEKFGFGLHFCTKASTSQETVRYNWCSMSCKQDLLERLMIHGCLPVVELDQHYQLIDRVIMQGQQITMLKRTVEQTNNLYQSTLEEHKKWIVDQNDTMQIMEKTVNAQMMINAELQQKVQKLQKQLDEKNSEGAQKDKQSDDNAEENKDNEN